VLITQQTTPAFHRVKKVITNPDGFDDALSGTTLKVDILSANSFQPLSSDFSPATGLWIWAKSTLRHVLEPRCPEVGVPWVLCAAPVVQFGME
jgi:hypothetical protein